MLSKKLEAVLNEQLNHEFYASYLYLSLAAYFASLNLIGFSRWMHAQAEEERQHAMRIYHYILNRGGQVQLRSVAQPPTDFGSPRAALETALQAESENTRNIYRLYELAKTEKDYATEVFLHEYVTDQVEDESKIMEKLETLKMIGDRMQDVVMLDLELREHTS